MLCYVFYCFLDYIFFSRKKNIQSSDYIHVLDKKLGGTSTLSDSMCVTWKIPQSLEVTNLSDLKNRNSSRVTSGNAECKLAKIQYPF